MKTEDNDKYLDSIEIPDILTAFSKTFALSLKKMLSNKDSKFWKLPISISLIFLLRHLIKQENHIEGIVKLLPLYDQSQELSDKKIEELEKKIELLDSYINHMEWRLNKIAKNKEEGEHGQTKTED